MSLELKNKRKKLRLLEPGRKALKLKTGSPRREHFPDVELQEKFLPLRDAVGLVLRVWQEGRNWNLGMPE